MPTRAAIWPSGTRVVWRDLTWGEHRKVRSHQGPPAEKALEVYQTCVLEGPEPDRVPAGIMMWIFQVTIEQSPFSGTLKSLSLPLEEKRQRVTGSFLLSAQALIASVFKVPFETMDTWDGDTFLTRIAQAEFIAGVPLNPVDPNAKKQGNKKRPKKPLTNAQQMAIDRKNENARPNQSSSGQTGQRPSIKSRL